VKSGLFISPLLRVNSFSQEKTAVLKELAEARLSVLVGGAGTGKTTLLALLCKSKSIQSGNVLLLAPTGKARVRMSQALQQQGVQFEAKTVAQFLVSKYFTIKLCFRIGKPFGKSCIKSCRTMLPTGDG